MIPCSPVLTSRFGYGFARVLIILNNFPWFCLLVPTPSCLGSLLITKLLFVLDFYSYVGKNMRKTDISSGLEPCLTTASCAMMRWRQGLVPINPCINCDICMVFILPFEEWQELTGPGASVKGGGLPHHSLSPPHIIQKTPDTCRLFGLVVWHILSVVHSSGRRQPSVTN